MTAGALTLEDVASCSKSVHIIQDLTGVLGSQPLVSNPVFVSLTGSEHLIGTYCESREHRVGASRS